MGADDDTVAGLQADQGLKNSGGGGIGSGHHGADDTDGLSDLLDAEGGIFLQNAAGLLVAGNEFPIVGGEIIELNFMPDNVIVGGYADLYLLAERAGTEVSTSEHAFWVADQTGFKGTARYDGKVLDVDGFVAIGLNGADGDDMVHSFPQDGANL